MVLTLIDIDLPSVHAKRLLVRSRPNPAIRSEFSRRLVLTRAVIRARNLGR